MGVRGIVGGNRPLFTSFRWNPCVRHGKRYCIYLIKHLPQLTTADGSKITKQSCPQMNAAHNGKNAAFIQGGQLGNLQHPDIYDSISGKWIGTSKLHNIFKRFTL